jgi:hypothetical protein
MTPHAPHGPKGAGQVRLVGTPPVGRLPVGAAAGPGAARRIPGDAQLRLRVGVVGLDGRPVVHGPVDAYAVGGGPGEVARAKARRVAPPRQGRAPYGAAGGAGLLVRPNVGSIGLRQRALGNHRLARFQPPLALRTGGAAAAFEHHDVGLVGGDPRGEHHLRDPAADDAQRRLDGTVRPLGVGGRHGVVGRFTRRHRGLAPPTRGNGSQGLGGQKRSAPPLLWKNLLTQPRVAGKGSTAACIFLQDVPDRLPVLIGPTAHGRRSTLDGRHQPVQRVRERAIRAAVGARSACPRPTVGSTGRSAANGHHRPLVPRANGAHRRQEHLGIPGCPIEPAL